MATAIVGMAIFIHGMMVYCDLLTFANSAYQIPLYLSLGLITLFIQQVLNVLGVVIVYTAELGRLQPAIDTKRMKGAWGNFEQLHNLVGFEPCVLLYWLRQTTQYLPDIAYQL